MYLVNYNWTRTVSLKYKVAVKVLNLVLAVIQKKLNLTRCTFLHFGKHSRTIEISLRIHRINLTAL